jgi:hypothetical protein
MGISVEISADPPPRFWGGAPDLFGAHLMATPSSKELFILGMTHSGKTFRPRDWPAS